jgi:hypothetical protein
MVFIALPPWGWVKEPERLAGYSSDAPGELCAWPKPEEIATVVLFLSSGAAKTIHGAAVPVYGNA